MINSPILCCKVPDTARHMRGRSLGQSQGGRRNARQVGGGACKCWPPGSKLPCSGTTDVRVACVTASEPKKSVTRMSLTLFLMSFSLHERVSHCTTEKSCPTGIARRLYSCGAVMHLIRCLAWTYLIFCLQCYTQARHRTMSQEMPHRAPGLHTFTTLHLVCIGNPYLDLLWRPHV
jgi:hypothetical protein